MQTNQTPGALGEEALDIALVLRTAKPGSEYRIAYLALEAAINRLRNMAVSGAKDAECLDWLEVRRLEGIAKGYKWDTWGYDTDRPIRDQLAAIAATKRGGA